MSTTINVTVGGNGLLDQSRQQMQANRFGRLEQDIDQQTRLTVQSDLQAGRQSADGAGLTRSRFQPQPAALRRSNSFEGLYWSFIEDSRNGLGGFYANGANPNYEDREYWSSNSTRLKKAGIITYEYQTLEETPYPPVVVIENGPITNPYKKLDFVLEKGSICGGLNTKETQRLLFGVIAYGKPQPGSSSNQDSYVRFRISGLADDYANVRCYLNINWKGMFTSIDDAFVGFAQNTGSYPPETCLRGGYPMTWQSQIPPDQEVYAKRYGSWEFAQDGTSLVITACMTDGKGSISGYFDGGYSRVLSSASLRIQSSFSNTLEGLDAMTP